MGEVLGVSWFRYTGAAVTLDISNIRSVNREMHLIRLHPGSFACYCNQDVTPCKHEECTSFADPHSGNTDSYTTATIGLSKFKIVDVGVYKNSGSEDYMLFIPNDLKFDFRNGAMANLNGKAFHFGGKAEPGGPWMSSVFDMDNVRYFWRLPKSGFMKGTRKDPVVVAVPGNWLCMNKK